MSEPIWTVKPDLDVINQFKVNSMIENLGISFSGFTDNSLSATMPVDHRTKQPYGILHGGATAALAETLGSMASQLVIDDPKNGKVVGVDLNINHLSAATSGTVTGTATPIRIGRKIHVWQIDIWHEDGKQVSSARLTTMVL